jgi:hypothetical protein
MPGEIVPIPSTPAAWERTSEGEGQMFSDFLPRLACPKPFDRVGPARQVKNWRYAKWSY